MNEPEAFKNRLHKLIHEVNGSIFVIRGHAELACNNLDDIAEIARHLAAIMERCDQLSLELRETGQTSDLIAADKNR